MKSRFFRAVTGCHAVIHLENAHWWGRRRDLERVELGGARALAAVARAARVGRIITLSQLGAAPSSAYTLHRVKGDVEDLLRNSGVAYTIIRSGIVFAPDDAFINHIASMLRINPAFFLMPGRGEIVLHPIYIDDLVEAIYRSLNLVRLVDATVEIGGPEYMSLRDLILTIMRVTGMRRLVIGVPPYFLRWITGLYSRVLPRSLLTGQWLDILAAIAPRLWVAPSTILVSSRGALKRRCLVICRSGRILSVYCGIPSAGDRVRYNAQGD